VIGVSDEDPAQRVRASGTGVTAWDRSQREQVAVIVTAVALVVLRSAVPLLYEGFYFDSDQAIIGLMAKHLSELKRFPLFYDGLNYILGVESWLIAPFFWLFGPSVMVMRLPLVALNAVVAMWLLTALGQRLGVRPVVALVGALPFIMPGAATSSQLLETAGACVEPLVYVLLLWKLRSRPLAFGALLALGFLHREFTIFVLPALVLVEAASGTLRDRANLGRAARMLGGFAAVWLAVNALKQYQAGASLGLQTASLAGQMCFAPGELGPRVASIFADALPALYGGARTPLAGFRMNSPIATGSSAIGWMIALTLTGMLLRLAWLGRRSPGFGENDAFFTYLALVGIFTAAVYPLSCNVTPGQPPLLRYLLLGLLVPVGGFGAYMRRETSSALRLVVPVSFAVWGAANLADNLRLIRTSAHEPPSNEHRVLADYLVRRHVEYALAVYWDAYAVDFLARENVIVASVDLIRIRDYQRAIEEHPASTYSLQRSPCRGGAQVASWCVQPP
jgi:hypothetical protein